MPRVAILIDGAFFLKRLPVLRPELDGRDPTDTAKAIEKLVGNHLNHLNRMYEYPNPFRLLHRIFYYDALPFDGRGHYPVSRNSVNYATTQASRFRHELFNILRNKQNVALRLGHLQNYGDRSWILKPQAQTDLLNRQISVEELTDDHFTPTFRQKGVDMKIGIDIASLTLRNQIDTIVLVSGDADFVPAAKLARREGVRVILDPLGHNINPELGEHIDGLRNGLPRTPQTNPSDNDTDAPAD